VWDIKSGSQLLQFNEHTSHVNSVSWSPDGNRLASASTDKSVRVWDSNSGKKVRGIGAELIFKFGNREGIFYTQTDSISISPYSIGLVTAPTVSGVFYPLRDALDNLVIIDGPAADRAYALPLELVGALYVKLWSNTAGVNEAQGGDRLFLLDLKC